MNLLNPLWSRLTLALTLPLTLTAALPVPVPVPVPVPARARVRGREPVRSSAPKEVGGDSDPPCLGCGWFDSSHELQVGLQVS